MPPRILWNTQYETELRKKDEYIKDSLRYIYGQIPQFYEYNMGGEQKATTTVKTGEETYEEFPTKDNKHSEMRAIEYMLEQQLWGNLYGKIQNIRNASGISRSVTSEEFITNACHCGFCTITLQVLGLPLGKPTKGNYNFAVNYNYPLPKQLPQDPFVFVRYQQKGIYEHRFLKQALNPFIGNPQNEWVLKISDQLYVDDDGQVEPNQPDLAVVDWSSDICSQRLYIITAIRTQIWRCLYEINRSN